ncbi:polyprotein [Burdock mosaic virus]|nr:polyprotein [Burdock mosaic virus]
MSFHKSKSQRRLGHLPQRNLMMPSSSRGQATVTSTNTQDVATFTNQVKEFMATVEAAQANSRKNGMGCFRLVRAQSAESVSAELIEPEDKSAIIKAWDLVRFRTTSRRDTCSQYFHLHGVVFLMVPHTTEGDPGQVTISLHTGNAITEVIDTKTLPLDSGAKVVIMSPGFCVPLTEDISPFFYQVRCENSKSVIPCSVMAMWKQEISRKVASYVKEDVSTWALERLRHPQLVASSKAAAHLISEYYNTGNREDNLRPLPLLGEELDGKVMDVPSLLRQPDTQSQVQKQIKIESKRHKDLYFVPAQTCPRHSVDDPDREDTFSLDSAHVWGKLEAQASRGNHDKARFNTFYGFCGRQQRESVCGLKHNWDMSWSEEEASIQKALEGVIRPFTVTDNDYYDIGVLPKWEHFLYLIYEAGETPESLEEDYPEEYTRLLELQSGVEWCEMEQMEEELKDELQKALCNVRVTIDCEPGACQHGAANEEFTFYDEELRDAISDFTKPLDVLQAQAGDVTLVSADQPSQMGEQDEEDIFFDAPETLFDFTSSVVDQDFKELDIIQPAIVRSNEFFEVSVHEFSWKPTDTMCKQLLSISLPEVFNQANPMKPAGVELLRYFDAGVVEFEAEVNLSSSFAVTGELVLIWDEGDVLGARGEIINQASLLTTGYMIVGANPSNHPTLKFTPVGIGKYLPFDTTVSSSRIGSLRLYVLYPVVSADPTISFPGHVHLRAKILSTNIMQPPRLVAQVGAGMPIGEARIPEIPCSQIIASTVWPTTSEMGESLACTFSPSSVFEQNGILQPSLLCNIFRNCKWWTGECEFELHVDKSVFHSGALGIGFGTITSILTSPYDIFNTAHVIANLGDHSTYRFSIAITSWNGKNLFTTGRKSSLPKLGHQALLRIFMTVVKPLVTTNPALKSVNFHLMLKRIKNMVLGGSTPIRPVFGHWKEGKSGTDFFYSESDGPQAELLAELLKKNLPSEVKPRTLLEAQMTLRRKLGGSVKQYIVTAIDPEKRYLVIPVAPWSYEFKKQKIVTSEVNPLIDICSSFLYWSGSLRYTIILHRKQASANAGGVITVCYESSGYPIEPGLHTGKQPLASGGGKHWNFSFGATSLVHSFVVTDDKLFQRRFTRYHKFDKEKSRLDTLSDRLGNLIIYLPSEQIVNQVEIQVALGPDFRFSRVRVPTPASEKVVGDMESHMYTLTRDAFTPIENVANVLDNK